jgi:hypothetical protein
MSIFHPYSCLECRGKFTKGYPKQDDEYQFCCKICHDKYIEKHKTRPSYILVNY